MTKHIGSFAAIVAIFALPLTIHAQPIRGTASAGAATGTATRTMAGAPEGAGGAVLSAGQSAKVHEYVMKEKRPVKVAQKVAVGTVLPTSVELYRLPADLVLADQAVTSRAGRQGCVVALGAQRGLGGLKISLHEGPILCGIP